MFSVPGVLSRVLVLSLVLVARAAAADTYLSASLGSLELEDASLPQHEQPWSADWRHQEAMLPYVALDGDGEAYIDIAEWPARDAATGYSSLRLVVRKPAPGPTSGRVFLPAEDWEGMKAVRFRLGPDDASDDAEGDFHVAKVHYYENLLARDLPGAAWFRHIAREARERAGAAGEDRIAGEERVRLRARTELDDTLALFTGGRAVSENLQLDRLLPPVGDDAEPVAVDSLQGIAVAAIDWKPRIAGLAPRVDPLARHVPADQHAVFFSSFTALVDVLDRLQEIGAPIFNLIEPRAEDARTRERYERQLCLEVNALSRLLGPQVIASVAVTGSDGYLRTGTDVAVVFACKEAAVLTTFVGTQHAAAVRTARGAERVSGEIEGVSYRGVVSAGRAVSSYVATLAGDVVVVSNSLRQLSRVIETTQKKTRSLAELDEYTFFRDRYPLGKGGESALLVLSDDTIRRWCGPRWRIGTSRRTRAAAVLAELQARHVEALARDAVKSTEIEQPRDLFDAGSLRLDASGVSSAAYGNLSFLTPVAELEIETVTRAEASAYERWRDGYQRNWRRYFDPIALHLALDERTLAADLTVMPLIAGSEYRELIELTGGTRLAPTAGDPHVEALLHFVLALDPESEQVRRVGGFVMSGAPVDEPTGAMRWLGTSLALYFDADPFWEEALKSGDPEEWLATHWGGLPVGLRVDVANPLGATAFLAALRAFVEGSAPGMLRWNTETHLEQPFVRISARDETALPEEFADLSIYYALTAKSLTFSLNRAVIERVIGRERGTASRTDAEDGAAAVERTAAAGTDAAKAAAEKERADSPWLGESVALRIRPGGLDALRALSDDRSRTELRRRSWSALPVLNEWKRRYPDANPLELHERVWGIRLVCPGGGEYVWDEEWQTMVSTVFGHPGAPQEGAAAPSLLGDLARGDFGLTFEDDGLRARVRLERQAAGKSDEGAGGRGDSSAGSPATSPGTRADRE